MEINDTEIKTAITEKLEGSDFFTSLKDAFTAVVKESNEVYNVVIHFNTQDMTPSISVNKDMDRTFRNMVKKGRGDDD